MMHTVVWSFIGVLT